MPPSNFKALIASKDGEAQKVAPGRLSLEDLPPGDVLVKVSHSTINYKDGLAITGKAPVLRRWPIVPGIDLAGVVESSQSPKFKPGDTVVLNGYGIGEAHSGGFAEYARVRSDWLVPLAPTGFSPAEAAAIGTAGYTAMLCVLALEGAGVTPQSGEILVTGATGGVGSVAVALLAKLGYTVAAATGKADAEPYLKSLGAAEIVSRDSLSGQGRPLQTERWAGCVDSVGSRTLANALAQVQYGGAVAACGLAQGADLPATVMPFILRGVSLLGVDSVMAPMDKRLTAWSRLAKDLDRSKLGDMINEISLEEAPQMAEKLLGGFVTGRIRVNIA